MKKSNIIVTNNSLTVTRMEVIANRTNSMLMAGAKAMLIEQAKKEMSNGVCHFVYVKKNGELRETWGTLNRSLVEKHINGRGESRECYATSAYFDTENGGWRSFRWENIVSVC